MRRSRPILLAAGGTGGHLFPAEAAAAVLAARGYDVELATDERALRYRGDFAFRVVRRIPSATPRGGALGEKARAVALLGRGVLVSGFALVRVRPLCVLGFGGYPTVPPVLAASALRIPTILHEQNAVLGRANRFLAGRVDRIATGFTRVGGLPATLKAKVVHTGNPLRPAAIAAAQRPYPSFSDGGLKLLVTGGSQGARIMSEVVPAAIERLPVEARARIQLAQQARAEDADRVREVYRRIGLQAEVSPFFENLPARIANAHFVIARAGASTVSELAAIGRPCLLVPFPHALDQDQAANAEQLAATGAAEVVSQTVFTPDALMAALLRALNDPQGLTRRAEAAKSAGIVDAAERLADLVATLAPLPAETLS